MGQITGIGLSAGSGIRFRPLTLKARDYIRAKGAVNFLGRRVLEWILHDLQDQGVQDYLMVTKGKENRYQIKNMVGYGENLGCDIRYSPVRFDQLNRGSGDALLTNMEHFRLEGTAVVFPTDSVFDFDLPAMMEAHSNSGAVVTIATALQPAEMIANRYGLVDRKPNGRVRGFIEKPSLECIYAHYGLIGQQSRPLPALPTSAGVYLVNTYALRHIARHPEIVAMRREKCDIGGDLLPWLVKKGYPIYSYNIDRMGDLGTIESYLETMVDALHGRFLSMTPLMPPSYLESSGLMIDPTSLALADPISRLTLAEKLEQGLVEIHGPVRIGKYVQIFPGVVLSECNIDDDCEIYEHATIIRSTVGAGSLIGPHSYVDTTVTGSMVELQSTFKDRVSLRGQVALGDEVVIENGVVLYDHVSINPRLTIPSCTVLPAHTHIEDEDQVHEYCQPEHLRMPVTLPRSFWNPLKPVDMVPIAPQLATVPSTVSSSLAASQ